MAQQCTHGDHIKTVHPGADGCEDCLASGGKWVHLRLCMECGHVGCCDDSPNRHATKHSHTSEHPIIKSFEPGEEWGWCNVDEVGLDSRPWTVDGPRHHSPEANTHLLW
jgi:hypothetical protein